MNKTAPRSITTHLKRLSKSLESAPPVVMVLFGSMARGDQTATSDVDLLLLMGDEQSARALRKKLRSTKLEVHPLVLTINALLKSDKVYPSFIAHLLDEGRPLT